MRPAHNQLARQHCGNLLLLLLLLQLLLVLQQLLLLLMQPLRSCQRGRQLPAQLPLLLLL